MGDIARGPYEISDGAVWGFTPFNARVRLATIHRHSPMNGLDADKQAAMFAASLEMLDALKGAIGALEFSRDFHSDLGNEEQAFAQDKLDAALKAIAKATGGA